MLMLIKIRQQTLSLLFNLSIDLSNTLNYIFIILFSYQACLQPALQQQLQMDNSQTPSINLQPHQSTSSSSPKSLSILMVGRNCQHQDVHKIIQNIITIISQQTQTHFYYSDRDTMHKMKDFYSNLTAIHFVAQSHRQLIDYIFTIGGDGTILYAAKMFPSKIPPVISFMRGSLGFMCRFTAQQVQQVINGLVPYHQGKINLPFNTTSIMRIKSVKSSNKNNQTNHSNSQVNCNNKETSLSEIKMDRKDSKMSNSGLDTSDSVKMCINQVYVSRKTHQRIVLDIFVNGHFLTQTAGDGILISTPTGSTAYSLSAGGPILHNGVNAIMITPIAPNSLSFRPICFPSNTTIAVRLNSSSRSQANLSFDGQAFEDFTFSNTLTLTQSQFPVTFYEPSANMQQLPDWLMRLKYFLGWNQKYKSVFTIPDAKE